MHPMESDGALSIAGPLIVVLILVDLVFAIIGIVAWVKILSKAGYPGWWVLIGFVPLLNLIMFLAFAFGEWPVERELRALRSAQQGGYPPQGYGGYPPAGPATPYGPPPTYR